MTSYTHPSSSSFTLQDFTAALTSSASSSTRSQDYTSHLRSLLLLPRSTLPPTLLLQACQEYLDITVFAELNSSGGGLVVGRATLTAFDETLKQIGEEAVDQAAAAGQGMEEEEGIEGDLVTSHEHLPAVKEEEVRKGILEMALEKVQPRVLSFEDQASAIRLHLAHIHEALQDWSAAASVLQGIPLDSGHRSVPDLDKLRIYVRIVRLLLEADDAVGADAYLKRASMIVHAVPGTSIGYQSVNRTEEQLTARATEEEIKEGKLLGLQYKLCQARIYDAQRRFAEAALRFHELSYITEIDQEERNMMLSAAVTAAILAPAGPQRSRILSTLIRDDRTSDLPQASILSKVFLEHIVRPNEVALFEQMLQPHQKTQLIRSGNDREMMRVEQEAAAAAAAAAEAQSSSNDMETSPTADAGPNSQAQPVTAATPIKSAPTTVLDRAMMEHNILASSKLYISLTLSGLGSLLNLTPTGAETMVRRMIVQGRLQAEIDQVEDLLTFLERADQGPIAGGLGESGGDGGQASDGAAEGGGGGGGAAAATAGSIAHGTGNLVSTDGLAHGSGNDYDHSHRHGSGSIRLAQGDGLIRRWDAQIAKTASSLEEVCVRITSLGTPPTPSS